MAGNMRHKDIPGSCGSCSVYSCAFNAQKQLSGIALDQTAWLLDEYFPEFDIGNFQEKSCSDVFLLPWHGALFSKKGYDWNLPKETHVQTHITSLIYRSIVMRKGYGGGRRQEILEKFDRHFADRYAKRLPYNIRHLKIWQNFLPFLYMNKALGGRTYDILAWRPPRHILHEILDKEYALWPQSKTLSDFRSQKQVVEAEKIAFEQAQQIYTPNAELAKLYPQKAILLPWSKPTDRVYKRGKKIVFLGPTVGRNAAYSVREAIKKLELKLTVVGKNLEDEHFWDGVVTDNVSFDSNWLEEASLILRPASTDFKPRLIMKALSAGIPVIASPWCGLSGQEGLHFINSSDPHELAEKIRRLL